MQFIRRNWWPPVILLSIGIAICIYGLQNKTFVRPLPSPNINFSSSIKQPQAETPLMTGFEFTEYNAGKKIFKINAEKFYLRNKLVKPFGFRVAFGKSAELEAVTVVFYRQDMPVSTLYSKEAVMDVTGKNVVFEGNPGLITEDKRTLSAKKIYWNNFEGRLSAEGNCVLGAEGKRRGASRINTDVELRNFTLIDKRKY